MSEQQAEETIGEAGSLGAGPSNFPSSAAPAAQGEPVVDSAPEISVVESPLIASDHEAPKVDEPKAEQGTPLAAKRRLGAVAAVVALSTIGGALSGALATVGIGHLVGISEATNSATEASIARIDADILALKAGLEHASKMEMSQFSKASDRLDKLEKAQGEPAAKLAKLSEAVDKLRAPVPVAVGAAPAASKEVTGSTAPAPAAAAAAAAPKTEAAKPEVARLPTVEGWVLTDVGYGGALIENRRGSYEVYAGDTVRGLGRIDAIRRQDGRWVVVTSKGLITSR
jgi:hypothetical protein